MRRLSAVISISVLALCSVLVDAQSVTTNTSAAVPPLVNFSGLLTDVNGKPLTGVVGVTFLLYKDAQGGAPLWIETQNVQPDKIGHYTAILGSTSSHGLPADIFVAGEAHWLGVQVQGQHERPRVLLVSTPYALKAGDAETLGGFPPSAFVLAAPNSVAGAVGPNATPSPSTAPPAGSNVTTAGGFASTLPLWTSATNIQSSVITQIGTGTTAKIGINTATPTSALDVRGGGTVRGPLILPATGNATATVGRNSQPLNMAASAFNSGTSAATNQMFQWQAEPARNNTASPSATLNLLFGSGAIAPAETGLSIASNGAITANGFISNTSNPSNYGLEGNETATSGYTAGVYGTSASPTGNGVMGVATSTGSGAFPSSGVDGISYSPNGYGVQGSGGAAGVYGTTGFSSTGYGVEGLGNNVGVFGTTAGLVASNYGVMGTATFPSGAATGVYGSTASSTGYGVEGIAPNVGVFGRGSVGVNGQGTIGVNGKGAIGIKGIATSGGIAGQFQGGPVSVAGNGNSALIGDAGCGSGYAGVGFTTSGLSGCTNYALLGGPNGGTYVNAGGTASIHFRSNNNELATIDNSGNVNIIGQNGGGNLTVAGKIASANVTAKVSASNGTSYASVGHCTGTLSTASANCLVPNMTITKTTANPSVLVMANLGGVTTDQCVIANFYLVVDSKIVALSSVSYNSNNNNLSSEINSVTIMSLQNLAAGSHTFQVQEADDNSSGGCNTFIGASGVSQGDGSMGSQRTIIVREF
ncbi:MAG TPA: hypothetical protein VFE61_32580 [Candidatus Sulfotelmatobacter sp.]|nr:hypothetical protein [Candidatus Sulfotelmatobacter sp.]